MGPRLRLVLLAAGAVLFRQGGSSARGRGALFNKSSERAGKIFPIFNIVTFKNEGCRSQSTISGGTGSTARNGTCYTSQECSDRGGTASGNCAAGFGVCCVFIVTASGGTISQNCTYIQNPGFPNAYADTTAVSYTVSKCDGSVCALRLDFESFTILGVGNTEEVVAATTATTIGGQCSQDTFMVTTNTGTTYPTICGQNTGQHIYVEMGQGASDTATLNFAFTGTATNRMWEIKATQLPCYSEWRQPEGCFQYHVGITGRFTTFNFIPTNDNHLANQEYNVCIRQEDGFCCVEYQPCTDANSFSLSTLDSAETKLASQDSVCTYDYISIEDSTSRCNQCGGGGAPTQTKYCGPILSATPGSAIATTPQAICDCTAPFRVGVRTDLKTDKVAGNVVNTAMSRGTCLMWHQIPCC